MLKVNEIGAIAIETETLRVVTYNQGSFSIKFFVNNEDYYIDIDIDYKTIETREHSELILEQIKFSNAIDTFCEGNVSDDELEENLMNQINIEFNNESIEDKNELIRVICDNIKSFMKEQEKYCY
jgi:hypothetical protein